MRREALLAGRDKPGGPGRLPVQSVEGFGDPSGFTILGGGNCPASADPAYDEPGPMLFPSTMVGFVIMEFTFY